MIPPLLPSAVGFTKLSVYPWPGPDGIPGGSPHFHLACTEAYVVTAGEGVVETLSAQGLQQHPLVPGNVVWFSPGVIHRLHNFGGNLEIMVVMQNAGLPENGDFVMVFPQAVLDDPAAYAKIASLAEGEKVFATSEEAARHRRDKAVEGYLALKEAFAKEGPAALEPVYRAGVALAQAKLASWMRIWSDGPRAAALETGDQLAALVRGSTAHLHEGHSAAMLGPTADGRWGMCGKLGPYLPEGLRSP